MIRAFVAIALPEQVRSCLRAVQSEMKLILPRHSIAWTRPGNLHLTLRFLGNVDPSTLPDLQTGLREAMTGFGPLDLVCERLGSFPDLRFPRVVWAGVHDSEERLLALHRRVADAVAGSAGAPVEARFVGHITLARPKEIKRTDAERLERFLHAAVDRQFGDWRCRGLKLIQSELSPTGSRYTTLDEFPL